MTRLLKLCLALALMGCTAQVDTGEGEAVESQAQGVAHNPCPSGFHSSWIRGASSCSINMTLSVGVPRELAPNRTAAAGFEDVMVTTGDTSGLFFHNYPSRAYAMVFDPGTTPSRKSWAGIHLAPAGSNSNTECPAPVDTIVTGTPFVSYIDGSPWSMTRDSSGAPIQIQNNRIYCLLDSNTARVYRMWVRSVSTRSINADIYYQDTTSVTTRTLTSANAMTTCIGCGRMALQTDDLTLRNTLGGDLNFHLGIARQTTRQFYRSNAVAATNTQQYFEGNLWWAAGFEGYVSAAGDRTVSTVGVSAYHMARQANVVHLGRGTGLNITPWIDYGFGVALAKDVTDRYEDAENVYQQGWIGSYHDIWRGDAPVPVDPKRLGSAFFEGIRLHVMCPGSEQCIYPTWRMLRDQTPGRGARVLDAGDLRNALRAVAGSAEWASIEDVFNTLNL